jgi:putative transposase
LLGLNRSSLYYQPTGKNEENLILMRLLDEQYTRTPFYGVRKMEAYLLDLGHDANYKRARRLLHKIRLEAVCQKPNTSKRPPD